MTEPYNIGDVVFMGYDYRPDLKIELTCTITRRYWSDAWDRSTPLDEEKAEWFYEAKLIESSYELVTDKLNFCAQSRRDDTVNFTTTLVRRVLQPENKVKKHKLVGVGWIWGI